MEKIKYLNYWPVLFKVKSEEKAYREHSLKEHKKVAIIFAFFNLIFFAWFIKNDYLLFEASRQFYVLLLIRSVFITSTIVFIVLNYKFKNYKQFDYQAGIWLLIMLMCILYINYTRPINYFNNTVIDVLFIFSFYVLFPIKTVFKFPFGIIFTILSGIKYIFFTEDISSSQMNNIIISFFGANAIGIIISIRNEIFSRLQFKILMNEKEHKKEIKSYAQKLELINKDLDSYNHTVAHDLKTPLSGLIGLVDIIEGEMGEYLKTNYELEEYFTVLKESSLKMINIVDELLILATVTKIEDIELSQLNMNKIIPSVLERLKYQIDSENAKVKVSDDWSDVKGYAPWIEEVWANLISNAIKYGGRPPIIEIGCTPIGDSIKFWVKDNGDGVDPEVCEVLFKEFTNITPKKQNSHGLGLSIVKKIVLKLNGDCGCEAGDKRGSVFYFTLPKL